MTYRDVSGFVNVLYGVRIPRRATASLWAAPNSPTCTWCTRRCPADIKTRLDGATATHDFTKFWDHMRHDKRSPRPPLTDEQRRRRPPVSHPVVADASDHRAESAVLQPRFHRSHRRHAARESDAMLA